MRAIPVFESFLYNRDMQNIQRKIITFPHNQLEMVNYIREQEGMGTFAATIRHIIGSYYAATYANRHYRELIKQGMKPDPKPMPELTEEEMCAAMGGEVKNEDGAMDRCYLPINGTSMMNVMPLSMVEEYYADFRG